VALQQGLGILSQRRSWIDSCDFDRPAADGADLSSKAYESAVKQLQQHLESSTKEKVGEMEKKVDELAELGKETFHDTKDHLTKAVNAAAHAFK
jgi:cytoplasmic iron level regulating protein YaaA (DUF328/UPF0246 family)